MGDSDETSYAESIAPAEHWTLVDCVALVSTAHKTTGSTEGHSLAATSPLQNARVADAPRRLDLCRTALLARDIEKLAHIAELDSDMMHAVMMTGTPSLFYWQPATLAVMAEVRRLRGMGTPVFYTIDAGANVHCLCSAEAAGEVEAALRAVPGVISVLSAGAGGAAWVER